MNVHISIFSFLLFIALVNAEEECEVCVKFISKFQKIISDNDISAKKDIKDTLLKECRKARGKENRFCYYIGATDDAATRDTELVVNQCSYMKPPQKICAELKKKDSQICELKYDKQIDWKNVNLKKMRVKELRKILADWDDDCKGCIEKQDFINRINELKPKHTEL